MRREDMLLQKLLHLQIPQFRVEVFVRLFVAVVVVLIGWEYKVIKVRHNVAEIVVVVVVAGFSSAR